MDKILPADKRLRMAVVVTIFLAAWGGSFWLGRYYGMRAEADEAARGTQEKHEGGYHFINPLLECQTPASYNNVLDSLENEIRATIDSDYRQGKVSHVSVYFRDLNNGPWIGINEGEKFSPASLMKVPILISYLKAAETDPGLLQSKLTVTVLEGDVLPQNIKPEEVVASGQSYTVEDLLNRMIKFSDNLAANTLLQNSQLVELEKTYRQLGIVIPNGSAENFLSVRDYAAFFRVLYNASYLNREMSERALYMLSQSTFRDGIVAGVPSYVNVAHKFGERRLEDSVQLHDCGIVYRSNHPYLLCVMTRGDNFAKMKQVIKDISTVTFNGFGGE